MLLKNNTTKISTKKKQRQFANVPDPEPDLTNPQVRIRILVFLFKTA
jgi:hypothetical protein